MGWFIILLLTILTACSVKGQDAAVAGATIAAPIMSTIISEIKKKFTEAQVSASVYIKNYSKYDLKLINTVRRDDKGEVTGVAGCHLPSDMSSSDDRMDKPIMSVERGSKLVFHSESASTKKKTGKFCTLQVTKGSKKILIRFLYRIERHTSKEFSTQSSILAVSVCNTINNRCKDMSVGEMEGSEGWNAGQREIYEFKNTGARELRVTDDDKDNKMLCVVATMSSTAYADIYINVYPWKHEDLHYKEKNNYQMEDKEWETYIKEKCGK